LLTLSIANSSDQLIGFTTDENDYNNVNSNYQVTKKTILYIKFLWEKK